MNKDEDNRRERIALVLGSDNGLDRHNFLKWREHLIHNLTFPLKVTGIEDFPWEEPYVMGGWYEKEYEELKKTKPSYTDVFDLIDILGEPLARDLVAEVKRMSDDKIFHIELSWLKSHKGSREQEQLLHDYSVWRWNY